MAEQALEAYRSISFSGDPEVALYMSIVNEIETNPDSTLHGLAKGVYERMKNGNHDIRDWKRAKERVALEFCRYETIQKAEEEIEIIGDGEWIGYILDGRRCRNKSYCNGLMVEGPEGKPVKKSCVQNPLNRNCMFYQPEPFRFSEFIL